MSYSTDILATAGLVSYWHLGEASGTAADSKGSNPGTTNVTATAPTLVLGEDACGNYDGVDDRVAITGTASLQTASITTEAWINTDVFHVTNKHRVVTIADDCFGFYTVNGNLGAFFWNGTVTREVIGTTVMATGTTYHVAGSFNDSTKDLKVFINGVEDATANFAAQSIVWTAGTFTSSIAASSNGAAGFWNDGRIDEAADYGVAVPAATLLAHYTSGTTVAAPAVVPVIPHRMPLGV